MAHGFRDTQLGQYEEGNVLPGSIVRASLPGRKDAEIPVRRVRGRERELYDLRKDPYELHSLHDSADKGLISKLGRRLDALRDCAGEGCRAAEDGRPK